MLEDIRRALEDLLNGHVAPGDRRAVLQEMRESLVRARMGVQDLRDGVSATERRLTQERGELETASRRKVLAEGIGDAETVAVAARFEAQHVERVGVLERKLQSQQEELALIEREVDEMTAQYKAAQAGVGSGLRAGEATPAEDGAGQLDRELQGLDRAARRAAHESAAEDRLAELKRRMGK